MAFPDTPEEIYGLGIGKEWGPEQQEFSSRHRLVAQLIVDFESYLLEQEPAVRLTQNVWTMTVMMPNGLGAGLKPQASGFYLRINRGRQVQRCRVGSHDEFADALRWLPTHPPHALVGRWTGFIITEASPLMAGFFVSLIALRGSAPRGGPRSFLGTAS